MAALRDSQIVYGLRSAAVGIAQLIVERSADPQASLPSLDRLTGLADRTSFLDLVDRRLRATDGRAAVIVLDLDRFKLMNDSLGYSIGDKLLVDVAQRLRGVVAGPGLLARVGGDEFALLVPEATREVVRTTVMKAKSIFSEPFALGGCEFFVTAAIGVGLSGHERDPSVLVRDADTAMYEAKLGGRGAVAVFAEEMRSRALDRVTLETQLHRAIERDEFVLHYQPLVDLGRGTWVGVEALARWQHPDRGLLGPEHFISLAEETGLINPLGMRLLDVALQQLAEWRDDGRDLQMGVNVSTVQLTDTTFVADLAELLTRHGVAPQQLILEITETSVMEHLESAREAFLQLRKQGVGLVIDDFGTGHSSIARLSELPFTGLKIDRRFAGMVGSVPGAERVFEAISGLAHALDLRVVVEGIESPLAYAMAVSLGCEFGQGYQFARPVPSDEMEAILLQPPPGGPGDAAAQRQLP